MRSPVSLLVAFLLLSIAACAEQQEMAASVPAPESIQRPSVAELQSTVRNRIPLKTKWSRIVVEEADRDSVKLAVIYNSMPTGHAEIEQDTTEIARVAIAALVDAGRNPSQERLYLSVWARKPETGETGKSLVRIFGKSSYNYHNDSIQYERMK